MFLPKRGDQDVCGRKIRKTFKLGFNKEVAIIIRLLIEPLIFVKTLKST